MTKEEKFKFSESIDGEKNISVFSVWVSFYGEPRVDEIRFGFSEIEKADSEIRSRAQNGAFFARREDAQRAAEKIQEIFAARKAESQNDFVCAIEAIAKEIGKN